jgi:mannose-1-phosphate guanylyltransferase/mannose-6-phosphate isomerase
MRVLLLAGGGGTRLWPLSTEERPKQFLPLLSDRSLLAETYDRVAPAADDVFVATGERHVALVREALPSLAPRCILAEPARRNSGPALLAAALLFAESGDPLTAAVPSDHTTADPEAFRRALTTAAALADAATVVVFGVPPTRPETDYGYLELKGEIPGRGMEVARFIEKPGAAEAEEYVKAGYLWNAGIFVFRPSRLVAEARRIASDLMCGLDGYRRATASGDRAAARRAYEALPAISIDYAVMERASGVRALALRAGWSDVGTWRSVRDLRGPSDERGNLVVSPTPVLAPGVRDTAIVVCPTGVLVLPFARETELRSSVERLGNAAPKAARAAMPRRARARKPR